MKPAPAKCRGENCGATIYWVITADGKRMPINAQPDPGGGFVVTPHDDGSLTAEVFHGLLPEHIGRKRFTSHFAVCPDADTFRKNR